MWSKKGWEKNELFKLKYRLIFFSCCFEKFYLDFGPNLFCAKIGQKKIGLKEAQDLSLVIQFYQIRSNGRFWNVVAEYAKKIK